MEAGSVPPETSRSAYTGAPVAGAVLATVFFPFIALIAALLLQGSESDPQKKAQLRTWAWISGGWLAFGFVVGMLLALVTLH
jgi:hypothetical protein